MSLSQPLAYFLYRHLGERSSPSREMPVIRTGGGPHFLWAHSTSSSAKATLKLTGSVFTNTMGPTARIFGQNLNGPWTEPLVGVYPSVRCEKEGFCLFLKWLSACRGHLLYSYWETERVSLGIMHFLLTIIFVHICLTFSFTVISLRRLVLNTYILG